MGSSLPPCFSALQYRDKRPSNQTPTVTVSIDGTYDKQWLSTVSTAPHPVRFCAILLCARHVHTLHHRCFCVRMQMVTRQ